jgi:hypothetical protein
MAHRLVDSVGVWLLGCLLAAALSLARKFCAPRATKSETSAA